MKKNKFLVSILAMTATLALGVFMGSCGMKDKINQWKCKHEEYKFVEVTEEATCTDEGKQIVECVDCGKTKTEKVEKLAHTDEDKNDKCDVCEKQIVELVEAEVGEKVVGNTYRLYHSTQDMTIYSVVLTPGLGSSDSFNSSGGFTVSVCDGVLNCMPAYKSGDIKPFDIKMVWLDEDTMTEGYFEFTVVAGEFTIGGNKFVVDDNTVIDALSGQSDGLGLYRVVPIE